MITPEVLESQVVKRKQELKGGDGDHQDSTGFEHGDQAVQQGFVISHMLEDIECANGVIFRTGQMSQIRIHRYTRGRPGRIQKSRVNCIDVGTCFLVKLECKVEIPCADVENPVLRSEWTLIVEHMKNELGPGQFPWVSVRII